GLRTCPHPTGTMTGGNHRSHWAISPPSYAVPLPGSRGKYPRRSPPPPAPSTPTHPPPPTPPAIPPPPPPRHPPPHPPTRGSAASTIDPLAGRSYRGGRSLPIAARTVFLDTFITRAITLIGIFSARCSLRISAQSSTESTPSTPWLGWSQVHRAEGQNSD